MQQLLVCRQVLGTVGEFLDAPFCGRRPWTDFFDNILAVVTAE
ncbi:hypothetical protein [Streptomyces sp. NPDC059460]